MSPGKDLRKLALAHGIALDYVDLLGHRHEVSAATLRALLRAMGVPDVQKRSPTAASDDSPREGHLAPMTVVRADARPWRIRAMGLGASSNRRLRWRIRDEHGNQQSVAADARQAVVAGGEGEAMLEVALAADLACGYYEVTLTDGANALAAGTLAVAPSACYRPATLRAGGRAWGVAVQLYALRSGRNWGIGDFTDLARVAEICGARGAQVIGVNPLHALYPHRPAHASPYSPSSRRFVNVLYVDVEAVAEFTDCAQARAHVHAPAFQADLAALRAAPLVDYVGVGALKLAVLRMLYAHARDHAQAPSRARWTAFESFKSREGQALARHALFEGLQAHFFEHDSSVWGWPAWPEAYRHPELPAVARFAKAHAADVDFYAWLQWQAVLQRDAAADCAARAGVAIGVYADLAVSADRGGAEVWSDQDLYASAASVGAPPDDFNPRGQDWGLPPLVPNRLRDTGYASFIAVLRANMRGAGALRIDHVMGLMRLYWVPADATPAQGAYVHYPFADLLGLVALESHRHHCVVIGEDLGTVPDEVRTALARNDILSYRVLWFERDERGCFIDPSSYPEAALAVASTHDLPTIAGWWASDDIALRARRDKLAPGVDLDGLLAQRVRDRRQLLEALVAAGMLPPEMASHPDAATGLAPAIACAAQAYLAATPSTLTMVQAEDALGVREQVNLPGTIDEHPNWRRKLPVELEHWADHDGFGAVLSAVAALRPRA
jgi:(1->4)-alpha-D-glucan 1-alpha-D-glucosylmutase